MTAVNVNYGTATSYTVASSLSAGNYDLTGTVYNSTTNKPADTLFEYTATVAANPTGNKQIVLFIQSSLDGTNFNALPASTTDTSHDSSMRILGVVPANGGTNSEVDRFQFSVAAVFGNLPPPYWRVIVKNDCGVALSSCSARTLDINFTVV
jgi:hypothetical protein